LFFYDLLLLVVISDHKKIQIESKNLIVNIGGTIGLFLVFLFISLLEIFEVLAECMFFILIKVFFINTVSKPNVSNVETRRKLFPL
jgi:hypothetical protein